MLILGVPYFLDRGRKNVKEVSGRGRGRVLDALSFSPVSKYEYGVLDLGWFVACDWAVPGAGSRGQEVGLWLISDDINAPDLHLPPIHNQQKQGVCCFHEHSSLRLSCTPIKLHHQGRLNNLPAMASRTVSTLKFVGSISLGLLTV